MTGDKGNDTIIDVDEYEDLENGSGDKRNGVKEQPGEQGPDYFDNIDNIDVNIEETFSANQQALYIQNFSNLGNLSQLRFQRGVGSQNRSDRRGIVVGQRARGTEGSNFGLNAMNSSLNNQSFS